MSYKDMRCFTEMMRSLGYPHLISMESFREPNFNLVSDILKWLVLCYDPAAVIPFDTDTQQDRVILVKSVVQLMLEKAGLKLNPRKIYCADGYAVKELLKIASLLYDAVNANIRDNNSSNEEQAPIGDYSLKLSDLKSCRLLASEITNKGAALYDQLGREVELREHRMIALNNMLDIVDIEKSVTDNITVCSDEITQMLNKLENAASDEGNLKGKIEKKNSELVRNGNRLKKLQTVRPAYMDEYDKLENELRKQYEAYIDKYRNLSYLEQQVEEWNQGEQEKLEETQNSLRSMQQQIRVDDQRLLQDLQTDDILEDHTQDNNLSDDEITPEETKPRVIGSMNPEGLESEESFTSSRSYGEQVNDPQMRNMAPGLSGNSDMGPSSDDDF